MLISGEWLLWPLEYRIVLASLIILGFLIAKRMIRMWRQHREENEVSAALWKRELDRRGRVL